MFVTFVIPCCCSRRCPLHWSSEKGHLEISRFLVESRADANSKDLMSDPPEYYAKCGHDFSLVFVTFVIPCSCSLRCPLHWSSEKGHLEISRFLVESRADVNSQDYRCAPPEYYAKCGHDFGLVFATFVIPCSCRQRCPLHQSCERGHLEISRFLVESRADVAATDRCRSPLRSRHVPLTPCVAALAPLHSNSPSTAASPPSLSIFAASARRNNALVCSAAPPPQAPLTANIPIFP